MAFLWAIKWWCDRWHYLTPKGDMRKYSWVSMQQLGFLFCLVSMAICTLGYSFQCYHWNFHSWTRLPKTECFIEQSPCGTLQPLKNNTDAASVLFLRGCKVPLGDCCICYAVIQHLFQCHMVALTLANSLWQTASFNTFAVFLVWWFFFFIFYFFIFCFVSLFVLWLVSNHHIESKEF